MIIPRRDTGTATATDNCAAAGNIAITYGDVSTYNADPANVLHYNYVITRTWRAQDVAGNFSTCIQTITVHDVTAPTFTVPPTVTVCRASDCSYIVTPSVTGDVTDESDNCTPSSLLNATYTDDLSGIIDCNSSGFILRTWTLLDVTGNSTVKFQTIWVEPTPTATIVVNTPIICDSTNVNIVFDSPTISTNPANLSFEVKVTSTDPTHLFGTASSDFTITKIQMPYTLNGTLINTSDAPIQVTYTVNSRLLGCTEFVPVSETILVNPTPRIFPVLVNSIQCDSTATNIILHSPSTFTSGVVTFKYTAVASGAPGDITGFTPSATGLANDYVISQTLINHTDAPQTVTYKVTPVSGVACNDGPSQTVVVTVNPTPRIFPVLVNSIQCDSTATNIILHSPSTFTSGVVTFKYTAVASGAPGDITGFTASATGLANDYVISQTLINHTDAPQTVTYKVTPVSGVACNDGPSQTVVVTVNPTPRIFPVLVNSIQCDSTATNIILHSPSTFTSGVVTFKYTAVASGAPGDITGFTPSATGLANDYVISQTLINHTDAPQTVTYKVTPVSGVACNDGPSQTVVVTVNPTPRIFPVLVNSIQCDSTATNIILHSPSTFTSGVVTFKYTAVASGAPGDITGFTASATGLANDYVISQTLINHTDAPQTVTYKVTPVSGVACNDGPSQTVVVTVNPTPRIFPVLVNSIQCDSTATNIILHSPSTFTSGVVTFKYTAAASGAPGDITGFTASATGLANDYVISQTLINHTDAPQTVTYTVTPVSGVACNDGPSQTVVVTVNPTPRIFPVLVNSIQCDSTATNIILHSPSTFTSGVVTFKYTAAASGAPGDITGFTASATGLANDYVISQTLINHTDAPQTVTYKVTPVSGVACNDGPSQTVVVTVNPTPRIFPVLVNSIQCDSTATNIILHSPSTFTSGVVTFKYTAAASGAPGDITGFTASATGLANDYVISQTLINHTDAPQTVTYKVTPVSGVACNDGPSQTVVVTVNPTPRIFPVLVNSIQCDSTATNIILHSPSTFTSGVVTFKYTAAASGAPGDITGFTASATGLANDYVISQTLINHTDAPQTVTYKVTPVSGVACNDGPSQTVVVTVNPTPRIFPVLVNSIQCDSTATNIILHSPSTFTSGVVTFKYTAAASGAPGDITGFTASATGLANDYVISQTLINHTDAPQTVTYKVTPVSGVACNDGPSQTVVVTVNPTPRIFPVLVNSIQCDSTATNIILHSPSTFTSGVVTFKYTAAASGAPGDITGFTASATGLANDYVISQTLINHTDAPQTVTYKVTPVSGVACNDGPSQTVVVTVNPTPRIFPVLVNSIQCDSTATNIILHSPSTFTSGVVTFKYTAAASGAPGDITGFTASATGLANDYVISQTLINHTDAPQTVTYKVTPVSGVACNDGPSQTVVVTVNPTPRIFPVLVNSIQCDSTATNIILHSPSTFTSGVVTFKYTAAASGAPGDITGFTPSATGLANDYVISQTLINHTDAPQTVTYKVTPVSGVACNDGPSQTVVVTVNPTPRIFPVLVNSIQCDSTATNIILHSPSTFTSGVVTFKYTAAASGAPGDITGFTPSATGLANDYVISQTLINHTDAPQTVTYKVTPVSGVACNDGPSQTVVVTVNPTPRIFPVPANTIQCDSTTTSILIQSPTTFTSGIITFKYTVTATGGVTGYTTPVNGLMNNYTITDNLINPTDTFRVVTYRITPVSPTGCVDGPTKIVTVTVNPTPRVIPINAKPAICYGETTEIKLTSKTLMTQGVIQFSYTVTTSSAAIVGNTSSDINLPANYPIERSYTNTSDTMHSVFYHITPKNTVLCNAGPIVVSKVKVHPEPLQSMYISVPFTCTGGSAGVLTSVLSKVTKPDRIHWTRPWRPDTVYYSNSNTDNLVIHYAGKYKVSVQDSLGCTNSSPIKDVFGAVFNTALQVQEKPGPGYGTTCRDTADGVIWIWEETSSTAVPPYEFWLVRNGLDTVGHGVIPATGYANRAEIDSLPSGSYQLFIRDFNTCYNGEYPSVNIVDPDPIEVTFDKSKYGSYNVSCLNEDDGSVWVKTITGGNGTYSYHWSTLDGLITGPDNTNRLDNITAGTYYLLSTDLHNCPVQDTVTLTEPAGISVSAYKLSSSPDNLFNIACSGNMTGSIELTIAGGSGNYNYSWSGPGTFSAMAKDIFNLGAGTYSATITDQANTTCIMLPVPTYTLTEPAPLGISAIKSVSDDGAYNINCHDGTGSIDITVTGGSVGTYIYTWSTADGSGIIPGLEDQPALTAGTYHLVVKDANNCSLPIDVILTEPTGMAANLIPTHVTCNPPGFNNGAINLTVTGGIGSVYLQLVKRSDN